MKKLIVCATTVILPSIAFAAPKDRRADREYKESKEATDSKPSAYITGFLALDIFKWVKKEGSNEDMNVGIGTINVDARARNGGTSLKIKLDLDGDLMRNPNALFEEATITQEVTDNIFVTAGKGVVPFHQKHYGVINDSYFDGGTVVGNYYWNYGDQDRRYLLSLALGEKGAPVRNFVTFYGEGAYQDARGYGTYVPKTDVKNERLAFQDRKGIDPRDQRGIADKVDFQISKELLVAAAALYTYNRVDPHTNYAFVTSGKYFIPQVIEAWYEAQYGYSSSYRYNFKNKKEVVAQVGADYYLTPTFSVLTDAESANFAYVKTGGKSEIAVEGVLSKLEVGVATHFSDRATWTNGFLYEIGDVSEDKVTKTTGRNGQQLGSSFTFSF